MTIKVVIFDLGGVLLPDFFTSETAELIAKKHGKNWWKVRTVAAIYWTRVAKGEITPEEYFRGIVQSLGLEMPPERLEQLLKSKLKPNSRVRRLIKRLDKKGYKVVALSNYAREWVEAEISGLFYKTFISSDFDMVKPGLSIYQKVLKDMAVPAEECLFIDNHERNLLPARLLGFHVLKFEGYEKLVKDLKEMGVRV